MIQFKSKIQNLDEESSKLGSVGIGREVRHLHSAHHNSSSDMSGPIKDRAVQTTNTYKLYANLVKNELDKQIQERMHELLSLPLEQLQELS